MRRLPAPTRWTCRRSARGDAAPLPTYTRRPQGKALRACAWIAHLWSDSHSRLAQHFFEEIADRRIARGTPGVLLLGAEHAAAKPFRMGQTTTRIILEQHGYHCTSILIVTDLSLGSWSNDSVFRMASGNPPAIRLGSLTLQSPISFNTRWARSPFYEVRLENSDSGYSIAEQYEFVVLHTGFSQPLLQLRPTAPRGP